MSLLKGPLTLSLSKGGVALLLLSSCLALAGCLGASMARARATEAGMPCGEANQVARAAIMRMGYTITKMEPAKEGTPGTIVASKIGGWMAGAIEGGESYTVMVKVTCSNQGAEFESITNQGFTEAMDFHREFPETITLMAKQQGSRPRADDPNRQGLLISVEPLRSRVASAELGVDLPAAGVTPVRVRITNRTSRTYGFQPDNVQLVAQDGKRVAAIALSDVTGRVASDQQAVIRDKHIAAGDVAPGATLTGFMYFPASAYQRAKVVLLDRDSDETEGFSVEF